MPLDWDLVDTPLTSISAFAWSPSLSRLVALGDVYLYSDDGGINWTETTKPTIFANDTNSLVWSPSAQIFVCVLNNNFDTDCVVTSPDGITWTVRTAPVTGHWNAVCDVGGYFVAVGNDGKCMHSADGGITWTIPPGTDLVSLGATTDWDGIAYNSITQLYVIVARGGNIRIGTSPDGILWTGRHGFEVAYQKVWKSIAVNPDGIMVATSEANGYDIMRSDGGEIWETPYIFQPIFAISYAVVGTIWSNFFDRFMFIQWTNNVAVADELRAVVYMSETGEEDTWEADEGILPGAEYDTGFGMDTSYRWNSITEAFELERWVAGFGLESETAIITSLEDAGPPVEPDTILELIGGEEGGIEMSGGGSGYFEWGWAYTGSGGIEMGGDQTQMVLSVDSSGIYTFISDQRFDRVYTRNEDPDDTTDVKIPDPFIKTAYIGS